MSWQSLAYLPLCDAKRCKAVSHGRDCLTIYPHVSSSKPSKPSTISMLSLETDFDLVHDLSRLFKDIAAEESALQLSPPSGPKPTPPHPDAPPSDRGLTVVGAEKGYLLLAFDGYSKEKQTVATWIGLYDLRTGLHRVVYRHYAPIRVVNASLSEGGTLLVWSPRPSDLISACTYITIEVNTPESREERYVTCLMELNQRGRVYYLCSSYGSFQRAQFIHSDPPKPSSPSASLSTSSPSASFSTSSPGRSPPRNTVKHFLLLFVHPDRIDLYTFVTDEKQEQWRILEQPKKGNAIVWKFKWAQWSSRNRTLYYLTTQDKGTYFLQARRFSSNPSDPSSAITYSREGVILPDEASDSLGANAANRTYDYHRCLHTVSDCHLDIELVRVPQTDDAYNARAVLCLCRQIVNPTLREVWVVGLTFDEEDVQTEAREVRVRVPVGEEGDEGEQIAEGRRRRVVLGRLGELAVGLRVTMMKS
ncbi:hypothetical protein BC937DRAFT_90716 [Endogone sp. FLAS-F59071]|nr:hypothetical protein BC937DRAFT_90716 [Endogone sp. FLAS-F59071]|eukprot:RUS21996.1 hypothetical protein BC937DRAFT_90716 [Endogone sp. FLAS-F59071]